MISSVFSGRKCLRGAAAASACLSPRDFAPALHTMLRGFVWSASLSVFTSRRRQTVYIGLPLVSMRWAFGVTHGLHRPLPGASSSPCPVPSIFLFRSCASFHNRARQNYIGHLGDFRGCLGRVLSGFGEGLCLTATVPQNSARCIWALWRTGATSILPSSAKHFQQPRMQVLPRCTCMKVARRVHDAAHHEL